MRPARNDLGDPHALLEHDDFLRALARGLVLDEARADDVVQQAWIAAIERGPDRPASLRAWLATAVRRLAWKLRRGEGRRERHEQSAARREATPSVEEIVAREQARRRVVEAVLQLDEPHRTTLLLRYFERLPPRAIAERMGVPVETVRTRIKRSLERLRARLDAEHGGTRAEWAVAMVMAASGSAAVRTASYGSRNSPKRYTSDPEAAARLRCVAKMPAKVCGVPPASSATPVKNAAGTTNEPTATGAAVPIW